MPRPRSIVPRYCRHKSTGRAHVRIDGRFKYLGPYGTAASREEYARLVRQLESAGGPAAAVHQPAVEAAIVTVSGLLAAFWEHAKATYPYDASYDGRRPPGEIGNYHDVMRPVLRLFGSTPAAAFTPESLELLQQELIAMGWCRNVVNRQSVRVRTMFKFGVRKKMVPGEVLAQLQAVPAVRRNQRGVRNTAKVRPVPADVLAATLAHCSPRVAAMIRVPAPHGHEVRQPVPAADRRRRAAGGRSLAVPAEQMAEVRAARSAARKTPLSCGNRPGGKPAKRSPRRRPRDHYTPTSYAQAVTRACDRADHTARRTAATAGGALHDAVPAAVPPADRLVSRWHPHQLRHNRGTAVRAKHGTDGVLAALGQRTASMADRYAEIEAEKAERIAAELG